MLPSLQHLISRTTSCKVNITGVPTVSDSENHAESIGVFMKYQVAYGLSSISLEDYAHLRTPVVPHSLSFLLRTCTLLSLLFCQSTHIVIPPEQAGTAIADKQNIARSFCVFVLLQNIRAYKTVKSTVK